jgi:hypothetical protein
VGTSYNSRRYCANRNHFVQKFKSSTIVAAHEITVGGTGVSQIGGSVERDDGRARAG